MKLAAFVTVLAFVLLGAGPVLAQEGESRLDQALGMINDDPVGARAILEEMSKAGDAEAMNALAGLVEYDNDNWPGDPARASELREDALRGGSKAAALNIALRIMMDADSDHARGIQLLQLADSEEKLRPVANYGWGRAYLFGWGVATDMAKGVGHFQAFLDSNMGSGAFVVDSHFLLGRAYRNGWDVEVDAPRAYSHFAIASAQGDPRAQWNVGMMLLTGEGVEKDEAEAYRHVRMSAEGGHLDGMTSHAVMLALGQGVEVDAAAAREWYHAAAELGSAHATRGLGGMLLSNEGGDPDPALGIALLELAEEAGDPIAPQILDFVEDALEELRAEIDAARAEWLTAVGPPDPVN